jgi:hypothetical protein
MSAPWCLPAVVRWRGRRETPADQFLRLHEHPCQSTGLDVLSLADPESKVTAERGTGERRKDVVERAHIES